MPGPSSTRVRGRGPRAAGAGRPAFRALPTRAGARGPAPPSRATETETEPPTAACAPCQEAGPPPPRWDLSFTADPLWVLDPDAQRRSRELLRAELAKPDGDAVALFFSLAGFYGGTGKRVKFGVFKEAVGEVTSTAEERAALRAQAAADLVNLDAAERQRRNLVGNVGLGVTGVLALALWATGQPGLLRFAAVYPLFALAGAFRVSGEAGL